MIKLYINSLYIFETKNKLAKKIEFENGINIITSNKKDGNDRGKSILMKSIYHTLGADCKYDDKWDEKTKVYVLKLTIDDKIFYFYRKENTFRILDENYKLLHFVNNREELGNILKDIYKFSIELENRKNKTNEIAPPVYSYLLNYLDQDHIEGPKFNSFKNLGQYSDFKEQLLYIHFGVLDKKYFNLKNEEESLEKKLINLKNEETLINGLLKKIETYLKDTYVSIDIESLEIELEKYREEYEEIIINLKKVKNNLIEIKNQKYELEENLKTLKYEKKIKISKKCICEKCGSLEDNLEEKIKDADYYQEILFFKEEMDILLNDCNKEIERKENNYKILLEKLNKYEEKLNIDSVKLDSVLKHRAYVETKDSLIKDQNEIQENIGSKQDELKKIKIDLKKYAQLKEKVNLEYKEMMIEAKAYFGLDEINNEKFSNLKNVFSARGSNKPIATVMWYITLLKLKEEFNSECIKFPIILDSPNNVESEDDKNEKILKFILENKPKETQLILSSLGFEEEKFKQYPIDKIITLKNQKYKLLNTEDYQENVHILQNILSSIK